MKIIRIICAILIMAGLAVCALALNAHRTQARLLEDALRASGEVTVRSRRIASGPRNQTSTSYAYRVRFRTATGELVEGEAAQTSSAPRFVEGQEVGVLYARSRPSDFNIDDFAMLWADVVVLWVIAGTLLGAGSTAFWIADGRPRGEGRTEARLPEVMRAWREGRLTRHSEFQPLLVAFALAGFPVLGGLILFVLFAPGVVQFIAGAILTWIAFHVIRQGRRSG